MVILGLGSNVGDTLTHLRTALRYIQQIPNFHVTQVSPIYHSDALLDENSLPEWNAPYLNLCLRCETELNPRELLHHTKQIEKDMGRTMHLHWGPRPIDIDLLAWDEEIIRDEKLTIPHPHLPVRPFALWPLADVAPNWVNPLTGITATESAAHWPSRFSGLAPLRTRQISQRIDMPELMAILNVTPDSFSNDGTLQEENILQRAKNFVEQGASILDFGAEASNSSAQPITAQEEWKRLQPILKVVLSERKNFLVPAKISIDTRHAHVAEQALLLGVDWINDVSGLTDPAMQQLLKDQTCDVVFMHHLGLPVSQSDWLPQNEDPVKIIYDWAQQQLQHLEHVGFNTKRLIFDVGLGFGKNPQHSLTLLQRIDELKKLNLRLLVGHSRKSFLSIFTDKSAPQRDIETLSLSLHLAQKKIDYLRLHEIDICARAFKVQAVM